MHHLIKNRCGSRIVAIFLASLCACAAADETKTRVFVLTDIENEPDDAQSLVRFLTYANHFEVEGLVATTSIHQPNRTASDLIRQIVKAYGAVQSNLSLHEPGYPTADHLLSLVCDGRPDYGMNAVGEGHDSKGSESLIAAADRDDPRPLWVLVWGGPNVLAQALWKVQATRSPEALAQSVVRLSAEGTSDPDGDSLAYEWFYYGEAGSFTTSSGNSGQPLTIENHDQPHASFTVPRRRVMAPGTGTMHIVLAVTDSGTPNLTRYQRVIVDVTE